MKSEKMKAGCFFEKLSEKFAEDSAGKTSIKISLLGTLLFWIFLAVFASLAFRIKKTPEYKTIRLVLETPVSEVSQKHGSSAGSRQSSVIQENSVPEQNYVSEQNDVLEKKDVSEKISLPEKSGVIENSPRESFQAENKNAPQKKQNIVYKKSAEELMAEQFQKKRNAEKTVWDDSLFGSAFPEESSYLEKNALQSRNAANQDDLQNVFSQKSISGTDAFSGTAGIYSGGEENLSAKSEPDSTGKNSSSEASGSTSASLKKIASAGGVSGYSQTLSDSFSAETTVSAARDADGRVEMKMNDGSSRILLDPEKPGIIISKENGTLIDSQRTIEISFRILSGGNVPFSGISFSPSAALPVSIQSEIKEQISLWRFSPASAESLAKFVLEIKKR